MSKESVKGYLLVIPSGLVLLAAVVLVILQWGNHGAFSAYGRNMTVNVAVLMLLSALGGIVVVALGKVFWVGAMALRRSRKIEAAKAEQAEHVGEADESAEDRPQ